MQPDKTLISKLALIGGIIILLIIARPFVYVPVGYRGIATRLGTPTGKILNEGVSFKIPFVEGVKTVEIRVQKEEVEVSAASKDLQSVNSRVAVNYALDANRIVDIYRNVGDEYKVRVIAPAIQESVKSVTAKFTAEELITRRSEVSQTILTELKNRLVGYGIIVSDLNIVDFDFSRSFNEAIEAKVTAEQNALAAKNKLEQIKYESEQAIATAKGKAEAQKIEGEALRANPEVLQLRAIEKWDGVLPQYTAGNNVPFLQLR